MPVVIKWNSANDIFVLDDMLHQTFTWTPEVFQHKKPELSSAWTPTADVYETDETIVVLVELAGINRDSLEIVFQDGYLLLRGNRPFLPHVQPAKIYRIERTYGCFQRAFAIPKPVDPHQISASYEQGIVKIVLRKQPQTTADKVTIPITFE
jgi:HSP20 family protein